MPQLNIVIHIPAIDRLVTLLEKERDLDSITRTVVSATEQLRESSDNLSDSQKQSGI